MSQNSIKRTVKVKRKKLTNPDIYMTIKQNDITLKYTERYIITVRKKNTCLYNSIHVFSSLLLPTPFCFSYVCCCPVINVANERTNERASERAIVNFSFMLHKTRKNTASSVKYVEVDGCVCIIKSSHQRGVLVSFRFEFLFLTD